VPAADGKARVQSVVTDPHAGEYEIRDSHFNAIRNAKSEIDLIYPYFSDDGLVGEIIKAKQANPNLKVKVLMPAGKEASHEGSIYSSLNMETAAQLLKVGVEIRMYEGEKVNGKIIPRFSHFKGMLVDNKLLSLGGANGDARTYASNHELNTLISDDSTIQDFHKQVLDPDWAAAKPLTMAEVDNVPFMEKVKRKALEALDPLL
ncbi:MAG TPA: phospholipase D-like domain-containing protein, partial [Chroococcales cyanobacterium]